MKNPYFGRLLTAMVTPFNADGSVNYEKAADLAEWLINNGSDGLVVAGSTGEAATMSAEEKLELFRVVVNRINKRVPVIAGTGSNNTADSIKMTKMAEAMGVDGVLIVGPYYNKPTQEGFYQHFAAVAQSTALPIIVYNVPGRTASNIAPATVARLAEDFENIVAIKEAAGNVAQVAELYTVLPEDFTIYSGDDGLILPFMSVGATGLISVLSNIGGGILQDVMQAYEDGRVKEAAKLNAKMVPLANAMFIETNPIPVKAAVTLVTGIDAGQPRLPLTPMEAANKAKMTAVLQEYGLVK
ncbi:4-hydroxy-tetrahydrodipicolinate synthase [uncultured Phascolarctobacterium sp.]|jgi:4-hydroxy-tetrahydrodipicolinate synthase|uniref:4-hydroxy-tetrahydrodipicolinate synthase n=1 Tax=uncultured Phascolarctobacterium sp. TaxID=512296 RepID=UPI0025CDCE58|nr:4-hydroxy-tetrahydrodipicolinate synthase [uncultured Phascolarctobacterium sp.]MDO5379781.1 4-hydroxy-tetrahydrodipicolinate synthase [Acidaminococcaceae bacterium]